MQITVVGGSIHDIKRDLGAYPKDHSITIDFNTGDFGNRQEYGCVINCRVQKVPLEFKTSGLALAHLKKLFGLRDRMVAEELKKRRALDKQINKK